MLNETTWRSPPQQMNLRRMTIFTETGEAEDTGETGVLCGLGLRSTVRLDWLANRCTRLVSALRYRTETLEVFQTPSPIPCRPILCRPANFIEPATGIRSRVSFCRYRAVGEIRNVDRSRGDLRAVGLQFSLGVS